MVSGWGGIKMPWKNKWAAADGQRCPNPKCTGGAIVCRTWAISDTETEFYRCTRCGHTWWGAAKPARVPLRVLALVALLFAPSAWAQSIQPLPQTNDLAALTATMQANAQNSGEYNGGTIRLYPGTLTPDSG